MTQFAPVIEGGGTATDWYLGQVPFQLVRTSATVLSAVALNPNFVAGPGAGADFKQFAASYTNNVSTDAIIDSTGALSAPPAALTLHWVYYCGAGAADGGVSGTIRLSTQAPSIYFGQYVLDNSTAFGRRSPLLGAVYLNGSAQLQDDTTFRGVLSYYFRRRKSLLLTPGYVNDNVKTTLAALNNAVFGRVNGGTGDTGTFLTWGEDAAEFRAVYTINAATTAQCIVGIGIDSNTTPSVVASIANAAPAGTSASVSLSVTAGSTKASTVTMLGMTNSAAVTFVADFARTGAAADPAATYLVGTVWG